MRGAGLWTRIHAIGLVVALETACRCESSPHTSTTLTQSPDAASSASTPPLEQISRTRSFSIEGLDLGILDIHMSSRLDDVQRTTSARLVVNGGFFDLDGAPLGLAVSKGVPLAPFRPTLSGGVLWTRGGVGHLTATEEYNETTVDFAIQCRPRLVVGSRLNIRSDDGRRAERTALCLRDGGHTLQVIVALGERGGPTLYELADELVAVGCEEALNLDGGPSTGWVAAGDGGLDYLAPRGAVRHAVVVR